MSALNYRHLHYFWVVAKEGGFARAADRLGMAVQTISAQVRELEKSLGHQLLKPQGRGFSLTEAGEAAFARAEEIFQEADNQARDAERMVQAMEEFSVALQQGAKGVEAVAAVSRRQLAAVGDAVASSQQLTGLSEELRGFTRRFRTDDPEAP